MYSVVVLENISFGFCRTMGLESLLPFLNPCNQVGAEGDLLPQET